MSLSPKLAGLTFFIVSLLVLAIGSNAACAMPPSPFGETVGEITGDTSHELATVASQHPHHARLSVKRDDVGQVRIELPEGADAYVLPTFSGVYVGTDDEELMAWLQSSSPLSFTEQLTVPFVALRWGDEQWVYALPEPHYAELEVADDGRLSIVFTVTPNRTGEQATPMVVEVWAIQGSPIDAAISVRQWLQNLGIWRSLEDKIAANPKVERLLGASHFYLFGDGLFSWHDVPRKQWTPLAKQFRDAEAGTVLATMREAMNKEGQDVLKELTEAEWPSQYAKKVLARHISAMLRQSDLISADQRPLGPNPSFVEIVHANKAAFVAEAGQWLAPPERWGNAVSLAMLDLLRDAGIDRAVLTTHDLDIARFAPQVAAEADRRGLLLGPYDSYGSIHSPNASPNNTWQTAQFDQQLYETGMIIKADGQPFHGFKKRGYRLSPTAAWPAVQERVHTRLAEVPFSSWFLDVDSFGQFFDDYHPDRPVTKLGDAAARRHRMAWLSEQLGLVVGSEGASAVMTGPLHFAHGVTLPYYGWGDPQLSDRDSPYFLGRHWPPDQPGNFFKPTDLSPDYRRPYFSPTDRLPLFQTVFGDSVVATHHWQSGSLKYPDEVTNTSLWMLLYNAPPLYHINRGSWSQRKETIAHRHRFQSPIHRQLATAPLVAFDWLTEDRMLQQATYQTPSGQVTLTANFSTEAIQQYPAQSVTVAGKIVLDEYVFQINP